MYTGLLHLHNVLRWVILLLLLIAIIQSFSARHNSSTNGIRKVSLFLLIAAHITFLIGIYQYFTGGFGYNLIQNYGFGEVMKNDTYRFWAVEHIAGMLIAIILITAARGKVKRANYSSATWMYVVALILILASVPWPFREGIARPWFPGN